MKITLLLMWLDRGVTEVGPNVDEHRENISGSRSMRCCSKKRSQEVRYDVSLKPCPGHEDLDPGMGKLYGIQSVKQVVSPPGGPTCSL